MSIIKFFLLISFFIALTFSWQVYETPLQVATPNEDGVYEFDLLIEYKLTMFSYDQMFPVEYDLNSQNWYQLNSSLSAPCNASKFLVNNQPNNFTRMQDLLSSVNQYDGHHVRTIAINGKVPGDPIVVPLGAEVIMRVKNRLNTDGMTIHVHGVDKKDMWYTDGVAFIQQCPISTNNDYTYRFIADTPGTHFYHGHLMSDRGDGLVGGFVVKKPDETTPDSNGNRIFVEREYYALIQDIPTFSSYDQLMAMDLMTTKYAGNLDHSLQTCTSNSCWQRTRLYDGSAVAFLSPLSSILVNNKGWSRQEDLRRYPSRVPMSTYLIKPSENVKFRLVNGGIGHPIMIWLEYHKLTIVAADGLQVKPVQFDALTIFPGERYDVLIQGLFSPLQKNYRFIFETLEKFDWEINPIQKSIGLANLQYENLSLEDTDIVDLDHKSCTRLSPCRVLNCPFGRFASNFNYTCVNVGDLQNGEEVEDEEVIQQKVFTSGYEEYFININHDNMMNGITFQLPKGMPYYDAENRNNILKQCSSRLCDSPDSMSMSGNMKMNTQKEDCNCFNTYDFKLGNIVQLTLYNMGNGGTYQNGFAHPFHLHGTHFYVMKMVYPPIYDVNGVVNSFNPDIPCHNEFASCNDLSWSNTSWLHGNVDRMNINPSLRDTIVVPVGGYVVIRFRANNPGWWFAHCHLLIHDMAGMAFAIRIGDHYQIPEPPEGFPHSCGVYEPGPIKKKTNAVAIMTPNFVTSMIFAMILNIPRL